MSWDYQYHLPPELIAQTPANPRDSSRLMCINKNTGEISHHIFRELLSLLRPADVLVFNDTKVIPARLFGHKESGGKVEILLLKQLSDTDWEFISHPGLKPNQTIIFSSVLSGLIILKNVISFQISNLKFQIPELLNQIGHMPLPPYIHSTDSDKKLRSKYQTVYAQNSGSAAAPTAGLHFTPELMAKIPNKEFVTLHVGLGTFKTPTPNQITTGMLHSEDYTLDTDVAKRLNAAKSLGKRIIAVGTTTTRVLESCSSPLLIPRSGSTDIFIKPGYKFKFINGMITNFHLPGTSLLMLISALASPDIIRHAYEVAIEEKYRFYSFGDACLII